MIIDDNVIDLEVEELGLDMGIMCVMVEFDEMVVWGYEVMVDVDSDLYVRSIEEWL